MVRATTSLETERFELETVEGGWVELRPMTYAQFLHRRDMAMKMSLQGSEKGLQDVAVEALQEAVTQYEFKICVAAHNLEDENGRQLALGRAEDFGKLDPRIGQEIAGFINDLIQWESPKSSDGLSESSPQGDIVSEDSEA